MSAFYAKAKQSLLAGVWNWAESSICVALVTSGYAPDMSNDEFLYDVGADAILATSDPLQLKTQFDGVLRAADVVMQDVPDGTVAYVVLYADLGGATVDQLIVLLDNSIGLPLTVSGQESVTIIWDEGPNGIAAI